MEMGNIIEDAGERMIKKKLVMDFKLVREKSHEIRTRRQETMKG